jgi:ABC-type transport system involved in multi-copper enzyme maturation permease subunit
VTWPIFWVTLRERLSRPLALVALVVLLAMTTAMSLMGEDRTFHDPSGVIVMVLAAGVIGREVSSGVLPLLFTRPITRSSYVLTRWLAIGLAATALSWVNLGIEAAWLLRSGAASGRDLLFVGFQSLTGSFGLAAVFVLLSSLVPGFGDLGLWVLGNLAAMGLSWAGGMRAGRELGEFFLPSLEGAAVFGSGPISWYGVSSYLFTVAVCLALAVLAINRKELSYASG